MPQNSYTNADLARFERRPSRPQDMEVLQEIPYAQGELPAEPSVEALLEAARGSLARADELDYERGVERGIAEGGGRGSLPIGAGQVARGMVELLNPFGEGFDLGPDASSAEQAAANFLPFLTSGGVGAVKAGGQLALKGGRAALAGFKNMGLREASRNALRAANPRVLGGRASSEVAGYAGQQAAANPNQVLGVARELAAEGGDDVADVLSRSVKGGRRGGKVGQAGYDKQSIEALKQLAGSGERFRARQANIQRNSPFGYGGILPGPLPTELAGSF